MPRWIARRRRAQPPEVTDPTPQPDPVPDPSRLRVLNLLRAWRILKAQPWGKLYAQGKELPWEGMLVTVAWILAIFLTWHIGCSGQN